ncbi:TetR/AcrR family transcriptional regulator [Streptomyces sp. SID3343]|uniref:TetR/AcrR family transcriptional regulator n=1 Tax=Streptomyces sp. SID3343 TaxID=2690260 RepID=UPI001368D59F|nr:TetR/AcrR family transcriptional regulator [Streptomyces sp. SID3343]MYW02101.1 TetR family transcriptional regulator [Streptomyces sp. SID3343]
MGHREDLLAGAKRCLYEKGYARTTARDIVAASGTNLGSIGYHYGSKDALMHQALLESMAQWGDELTAALTDAAGADTLPMDRFEAIWGRVIELMESHRMMWTANFEILANLDEMSEIRKALVASQHQARAGLVTIFLGVDGDANEHLARTVGPLCQALLLGVVGQWILDPTNAPTGGELAEGMRVLMAAERA